VLCSGREAKLTAERVIVPPLEALRRYGKREGSAKDNQHGRRCDKNSEDFHRDLSDNTTTFQGTFTAVLAKT
jgi:hypothetical protein